VASPADAGEEETEPGAQAVALAVVLEEHDPGRCRAAPAAGVSGPFCGAGE
jgi:hypothetical protein